MRQEAAKTPGNGVRVAAVLPNGEAQYYLTDQVDSVKVVTNDSGLVVTSHEYMPFGEDWITEGDTKNAPKYNSQELDKESGYYFYNARHYDPEIARFVTPDTAIDGELSTQGWNRFAYVHNNPIRYKDPTGHAVETPWDVANVIIGAGNVGWTLYDAYRAKADSIDVGIAVGGLVADGLATAIPGIPGGASSVVNGSRVAARAAVLSKVEKVAEKIGDTLRSVGSGYQDAKKTYEKTGSKTESIIMGVVSTGLNFVGNKGVDVAYKKAMTKSISSKLTSSVSYLEGHAERIQKGVTGIFKEGIGKTGFVEKAWTGCQSLGQKISDTYKNVKNYFNDKEKK